MLKKKKPTGGPEPPRKEQKRWWQRPATKAVGTTIGAPVVVGLILAVTTNLFGLNGEDSRGRRPAPSPRTSPTPAFANAVTVVQVTPYNIEHDSWVADRPIELTTAQNTRLAQKFAADSTAYERSMGGLGAVRANANETRVILRGEYPEPVRITDIRPIFSCRAITPGTLFDSPGAGGEASVRVGFDLDAPHPFPHVIDSGDSWRGPYFAAKTYTLKKGEEAVFNIIARTLKASCTYHFQFQLLIGDKAAKLTVDDHGQPFRVSGVIEDHRRYQKMYAGGISRDKNHTPGIQWCAVPLQEYGAPPLSNNPPGTYSC